MKKLILALTLPILLLSLQVPPSMAQEDVCEGVTEKTIDINKPFGFCWDKNPEPDVAGYRVYRSTTPTEKGEMIDDIVDGCLTLHCFSDMYISDLAPGTYYFSVTAYDGSAESSPSDSVKLTVEDMPPGKPTGCVAKFF